jgi:hypothetical protein
MKPTLVSHTIYHNGCAPLTRGVKFATRGQARRALADVLRQVRRDLSVVLIKDGPEAYYLTNASGTCIFERSLRITNEGEI